MLELVCFGLDFSIFIFVLLILLDSLRLGSTIAVVVLTIFLLWLESSLSDPDSALLGIDFKINTQLQSQDCLVCEYSKIPSY